MGFLTSTIQVRSRFNRCRNSWRPHLERTKTAILEAAGRAANRRRALLFGAGLLHDIPLRELSASFEEVILADIVHSLPSRLATRRFGNVQLLQLDVTGVMRELPGLRNRPDIALPVSSPDAFLGDARLDLVVSVNLLSQLGWVPGRYLNGTRTEPEISAFQRNLVIAHTEYLFRLPGHVSLVTDVLWKTHPLDGAQGAREWGVLQGVELPAPDSVWDWRIAPAPERERAVDYTATVHAYADWKRAAAGWPAAR
jgi:hypothetical protein